jgi:phage tail-like protein
MARSRLADFMQTHRFWLFDVVPSAAPPFYVLGAPFFGFASITAPEYTAETTEIKQVNSMFKQYAYTGGSVSPIVLTRGVRGYDDTMWDWMYRAITGLEVTNRHLLLLHFTSINILAGVTGGWDQSLVEGIELPIEAGMFLPGKAWLLFDSIPTRYKAASDFDAKSGEVSISEIEIQPSSIREFACLDPI